MSSNSFEEEDVELGVLPNKFKQFLETEWPLPVMGGYAVCPAEPVETVQIFSGRTFTFETKSTADKLTQFTMREKATSQLTEQWNISYY